ncbi:unnamed protein product [Pleuronectes platessa]|uniref:Uncharacterized protein n=1 Tax=Pleuronectes platessa TaxID=8262 RepID=A0A9N7V9D3_PLEPL|nr:unnamed protein product [Pleuronectes platessa]
MSSPPEESTATLSPQNSVVWASCSSGTREGGDDEGTKQWESDSEGSAADFVSHHLTPRCNSVHGLGVDATRANLLPAGLCLNTPSEISHFKKIHEQLELPRCITAAITGFSADTA